MAGPSPNPAGGPGPRPEEFFKEKARQRQHPDWRHYGSEPRPKQQPDSQQYVPDEPRGRQYSLTRLPSSRASSPSPRRDSPSPVRRKAQGRYGEPQYRRYPNKDSREYSRSRSRRRSHHEEEEENMSPWFMRKELWATVASIAGVAAATFSANATLRSAKATKAAASASHRSANASTRIANGNDLQTRATINTAVAAGHQDHRGNYLGPMPADPRAVRPPRARRSSWDRAVHGGEPERRHSPDRRGRSSRSSGRSHRRSRRDDNLLERVLAQA